MLLESLDCEIMGRGIKGMRWEKERGHQRDCLEPVLSKNIDEHKHQTIHKLSVKLTPFPVILVCSNIIRYEIANLG